MRRREKPVETLTGQPLDPKLEWFDPADYEGGSDWEKYEAWQDARQAWAKDNLPEGWLPIPLGMPVPSQPFNPYGPNGERHISFGVYSHL